LIDLCDSSRLAFVLIAPATPPALREAAMMALVTDARYGLRLLLRHPTFAVVAIATLALGMALTTTVASVAWQTLMQPLPYRDEARVVMLWEFAPEKDILKGSGTPANFLDWRDRTRTLSEVGALAPFTATVAGPGDPVRVEGRRVTAGVFAALGVEPLLGRLFTADDERAGSNVAVLSHRLWQQQFGGDTAIVGRTVVVDEDRRIVVGVLRPDFRIPGGNDAVFVPFVFNAFERQARRSHYVNVVAKVREGVALDEARADMAAVAAGLAREYPEANAGESIFVEPIRDSLVGDVRPALLVISGAVGLVLLMACVNVASLLLARATGRQREMALRAALGAGGGRLARQLAIESLVLSTVAGLGGLALAWWMVDGLAAVLPAGLAPVGEFRLNPWVALVAASFSVLTSVVFGLAPAAGLSGEGVLAVREPRSTGSPAAARLRRVLVTAQVALAVVLLAGAGLLARSYLALMNVDLGFRTDHLLTFTIELPRGRYAGPEQWTTFFTRLLEDLRAVPGVRDAGAVSWLPLNDDGGSNAIFVEGRPLPGPNESTFAIYRLVTPGYFQAIGIPVLDGREFTVDDRVGGARVGAINETMARRIWPGERAIGKRLTFSRQPDLDDWITIVAVVGDTHHGSLADPVDIQLYAPFTQDGNWFPPSDVVVRTAVTPASIAPLVRERVRALDPMIPVAKVQTMDTLVRGTVAEPRFHTLLVAALGVSAVVLAAVGIYGLLAFSVSARRREIGVRAALGATSRDLARMIVGEGVTLAGAGLTVGVPAALVVTRRMDTLLFGVAPADPVTFAGIAAVLTAVVAMACYLPARRAARTDPAVALRNE
jgi:putative ABC transport system permease protein